MIKTKYKDFDGYFVHFHEPTDLLIEAISPSHITMFCKNTQWNHKAEYMVNVIRPDKPTDVFLNMDKEVLLYIYNKNILDAN